MNKIEDEDFKRNWEEVSAEKQQLDARSDERILKGIERKIKPSVNIRKIYWAAAAIVILGVGFYFFRFSPSAQHETNIFFSTNYSKKVTLPDGSMITLQPHSKIELAADFGETDRNITFSGKAVFDIAKDKTKPFHINAHDFHVQILGTKFFLDQTSEEQKVELFEGKVKIDYKGKITYLLPNETWSKNSKNQNFHYYAVNAKKSFSFQDESFEKVINQLEEVYHVKIDYPDQYKNKQIRGSFSGNLNEVLSVIGYPFNLKPEKSNDNVIQLK
ncbi:FecR family protein [Elizabethkingia ursingii]|uniref:FecR protein domain-containing protein n=1 Tax=Elizabethkingia ursingii TaxID=1756150 RepID=A0ABX3NCN2_9FLAO|nr:FecR family protein [Elizabethkingia ursingii]OPB93306.1 hypothetical protein BB021_02665 [Elizabethkingia ursingii]